MTKNLPDNLIAASEREQTRFRMLVTIYLDDTTFRLCANDNKDIVFGGETYTCASIKRSEIQANSDGDLEKITLTLSNRERIWAAYLANNGNILNNRRCLVQEVSLDYLTDPNDVITVFDGVMNNVQMTSSEFMIDVERTLGTYESLSPIMTYSPMCQWKKFKDSRCGYSGSETSCDRTLTRCQELSNVLNFGGHPSIIKEMIVE